VPFPAEIRTVESVTPTITRLELEVLQSGFGFRPGQWVDCFVDIEGTPQVGGYSLTSVPDELPRLELAIRYSANHPVTRHLCTAARPGDRVALSAGQGAFCYTPELGDSVLLVGGGIGITPLMSIWRSLRRHHPKNTRVDFLYTTQDESEIPFREELLGAAATSGPGSVRIQLTQPSPDWTGPQGRVDASSLDALDPDPAAITFLCGPGGLVEGVYAGLQARGFPAERIRYERWW